MAAHNNVKPRRPALFANAQSTESSANAFDAARLSLLDPVWLSQCATMLQTLAVPFAFYFKPVIVFIAMSWYASLPTQLLQRPCNLTQPRPGSSTEHTRY